MTHGSRTSVLHWNDGFVHRFVKWRNSPPPLHKKYTSQWMCLISCLPFGPIKGAEA